MDSLLVAAMEAQVFPKMTDQREAILMELQRLVLAGEHPDREEVERAALRLSPKVSTSTVYRSLKALVEAGLIREHYFGDDRMRYDFPGDHVHVVSGGKILDIANETMQTALRSVLKDAGVDHVSKLEIIAHK